MHDVHSHGDTAWVLIPGLIGLLALYWGAAIRLRRQEKSWSIDRMMSFTFGIGLLMFALAPGFVERSGGGFTGHMVQHLFIGMLAPIPLALAAPVTLLLASLPVRARRVITRVLQIRPIRVASHPVSAGFLDIGGMFVLYLTPLYAAMLQSELLHNLVTVHFLVAGYLFTWSIIGVDPAPGRPSRRTRLIVLILAAASHAILSKQMYGNGLPAGTPYGLAEIQSSAMLMYYGGDLVELLLAVILLWGWYQARGRQYERELRANSV